MTIEQTTTGSLSTNIPVLNHLYSIRAGVVAHQWKSNVGKSILIENGGVKLSFQPPGTHWTRCLGLVLLWSPGLHPLFRFMFDRMYFVRSDVSRRTHAPPIRRTGPLNPFECHMWQVSRLIAVNQSQISLFKSHGPTFRPSRHPPRGSPRRLTFLCNSLLYRRPGKHNAKNEFS